MRRLHEITLKDGGTAIVDPKNLTYAYREQGGHYWRVFFVDGDVEFIVDGAVMQYLRNEYEK